MPKKKTARFLLRALHLFGLDHLDPLILAALADAQPLLLIGVHGTAKSELLNRVAAALGLRHRHYNASLISFDDLLGYPVPNADRTGLEYLHTPGDLWEAESVFLDEISRCRPEHQNKLFSIIHERRVQGLLLEHLRYRWSAMNPPLSLEGDDDPEVGAAYQGSLPLDTALSDRFAYIASVPAFTELNHDDREQVITRGGEPPEKTAFLAELVEETRQLVGRPFELESNWAASYVNTLVAPLRDAGLSISGRRAVMFVRSIQSVYAACQVLGRDDNLADAAFLTLKWGLPQRAQGKDVREHQLVAVHREALKVAGRPQSSFLHRLRDESDPVRRVAMALSQRAEPLGRIELSQLVTDAWAGLSLPERYIFSRNLLAALESDRLNASTYELLMEPAAKVLAFAEEDQHQIAIARSRTKEWDDLLAVVTRLGREGDPEVMELGNLLYTLYVVEEERFDPAALIGQDLAWRRLFRGPPAEEAA